MAITEIPTTNEFPHYEQETTLDGKRFKLTLHFNESDGSWSLDVEDDDGPIYMGRRLVAEWPLLFRCADPRKPAGEIMCVMTSGNGSLPGFLDLGVSAKLVYLDAEELGR
jgi:hypothetical protein